MSDKRTIAIIGGGAAGLMAAAYAAEISDPDTDEILLIEQNDRMGKKLRITGKGRCNVTNHCTRDVFFANITGNSRFLFSVYQNAGDNILIGIRGIDTRLESELITSNTTLVRTVIYEH
mgnify:CR=1 FL=1